MANFSKKNQDAGPKALRAFVSLGRDQVTVILKGTLSLASRYVFDRAYSQIEKSFPTSIVLDAAKLSGHEEKRGVNAFTDFVLSLRQKGNRLRFVGLGLPLYQPLEVLGLVFREELGPSPAQAADPSPAVIPKRPEKPEPPSRQPGTARGTGKTRAKTKVPVGRGISIECSV